MLVLVLASSHRPVWELVRQWGGSVREDELAHLLLLKHLDHQQPTAENITAFEDLRTPTVHTLAIMNDNFGTTNAHVSESRSKAQRITNNLHGGPWSNRCFWMCAYRFWLEIRMQGPSSNKGGDWGVSRAIHTTMRQDPTAPSSLSGMSAQTKRRAEPGRTSARTGPPRSVWVRRIHYWRDVKSGPSVE